MTDRLEAHLNGSALVDNLPSSELDVFFGSVLDNDMLAVHDIVFNDIERPGILEHALNVFLTLSGLERGGETPSLAGR